MVTRTLEQHARECGDAMVRASGSVVQVKKTLNPSASLGVAVREYDTDAGPADYILFVDRMPVGVAEAEKPLTPIDRANDELESTLDAPLEQSTRLRQAVLKRAFEGRLG